MQIILPPSLRIGVLRGGPSPEYDASIKTGGSVLKFLSETHKPLDIFISRDGVWHVQGLERSPERILNQVDVVWNALHGPYGEDGTVQEILDRHGAKYTGADKFASAAAQNRWLATERAKSVGIKTPLAFIVRLEDSIAEKAKLISSTIPFPLVVKPTCSTGSFGLYKVNSFSELLSALEAVLSEHGSAIVQEYIAGKNASCNVLDNFRGQKTYAFPPVSAGTAPLSREENAELENLAKEIHNKLSLSHYSQSDFVVSPRRGIYFIEVNTSPRFSENSPLFGALDSVGSNTREFLHHIIMLALEGK